MSGTYPLHSVTVQGAYEPFELQVSRGQIMGHSPLTIFGYNPDLDQALESIWPDGGTVPHPTTAAQLKVSSTSTDDASPSGIGAREVLITGVDGNYNTVSETVILAGQTGVTTVNSYLYINGFSVTAVGSSGSNVGFLNIGTGVITLGVPAVLYDTIAPTYNSRTTGHYCVPAGYTAYMPTGLITIGQASGSAEVTAKLQIHSPVDNIIRVGAITTLNNGVAAYDFKFPLVIPEKHCIGAVAIGKSNNNSVSSMFNLCLIKNDGQTP